MSLPGYEDIPSLTEQAYRKKDRFVKTLRRSHSVDCPAPGQRIARCLGIAHAQVRALRRACWKDGIPIGSSSKGYFYATTADDLKETVAHIRARAEAEQSNLAMITKIQCKLQDKENYLDQQSRLSL